MPNGYTDAMRIFNKLLKPAFPLLHVLHFESSVCVDNSLLLPGTLGKYSAMNVHPLSYHRYKNWDFSSIQKNVYLHYIYTIFKI